MNNKILLLFIGLLLSFAAQAQIDGISYQAVIIDNNPQEIPGVDIAANNLPNADLSVRFTIVNAVGATEYQELHVTQTDPFGMINLMIGQGEATGGIANQFDQVYWSDDKKLVVEIDLADGNGFVLFSEQALTYIPYVKHREIVATSTLDVDGATNLNSTLNVNNGSTTQLSGDLYVEGTAYFSDGEFQNLIVHQNTDLNKLDVAGVSDFNNSVNVNNGATTQLTGTLTVDGASTLNNNLTVEGPSTLNNSLTVSANNPTSLTGTLSVDGETNLNNRLFVNNEQASWLSGQLRVDGATNLNNQVFVRTDLPITSQSSLAAYPLRVEGSQQGIAIQLKPDNPSRSNNYISFWGGTGQAKGRIEGNNGLTGIANSVVQATIGQIPGFDDIIGAATGQDQPAPDVAPTIILLTIMPLVPTISPSTLLPPLFVLGSTQRRLLVFAYLGIVMMPFGVSLI